MKEETVNQLRPPAASANALDRRQFLMTLGGGIIICLSPSFPTLAAEAYSATGSGASKDFNAYLRIAPDGRVTCFTGKIEMGQGIIISLAQMLSEELDVPLNSVDMVMGDTDLCPWDAGTFGSRSTKYFGPELQAAAAEARAVLIQLAAERLGVPADRLVTKAAMVMDKQAPEKKVSYGDLAKGKRIERHLDRGQPALKPASAYTVIGTSPLRTDAVAKVTGKAKFTGDITRPEMLHARIVRPPVHGAKLVEIDTAAAEKVPGASIVRDGDLIAVVHPLPDQAEKAFNLIRTKFTSPPSDLNDSNIFDRLLSRAPEPSLVAEKGDLARGKAQASRIIESTYRQGYVAHAPIETHTAVAAFEGDKLVVWASTQSPFGAQRSLAAALKLPERNVRVIAPFVGGGFGGKNPGRQVVEAARLARVTGKPVQVAWTRAEEFFYDTFQPAAVVKIAAGLDASNRIVFWDYHVYFAGGDKAPTFYDVPHQRTQESGGWMATGSLHPFATGAWRGPNGNTNTFARESHMDALAASAGMDPLEFRLAHLKDKRMIRVLEAAAATFDWPRGKAPSGRGLGLSCLIYKGTYVAAMGEAEVDKTSGACKMKRIVCAQDMGRVVNPEGAKMQMEGCLTMGLGYSLTEMVRFKDGELLDLNFDTYQIPTFSALPKIQTILVENPEMPPQEGGEPAITCMGALVANAAFDATGVRFTELPITPQRIKAKAGTS